MSEWPGIYLRATLIVSTFEESKEDICSGCFFYSDQFLKIFSSGDRSTDLSAPRKGALRTTKLS